MNDQCTCKDFKPNMEIINAPLMLQVARNPQHFKKDKSGTIKAYMGKPFVYCPWCGEELKVEDDKEITIDIELLAKLYAVCLNTRGLYDLIVTLGVKGQLPGYASCLTTLTEAIKDIEDLGSDTRQKLLFSSMNAVKD